MCRRTASLLLRVLQAQRGCQTLSFLFDVHRHKSSSVHHPVCGGGGGGGGGGEVSNISSTTREYKLR